MQDNAEDCGLFICRFAEFISRGEKFTFTQKNMDYFRTVMMYEVVVKQIMYNDETGIQYP